MGHTGVAAAMRSTKKSSAWFSVIGITTGMLLGIVIALNLLAIGARVFGPLFPACLRLIFRTGPCYVRAQRRRPRGDRHHATYGAIRRPVCDRLSAFAPQPHAVHSGALSK
jgi:hypothetical protein